MKLTNDQWRSFGLSYLNSHYLESLGIKINEEDLLWSLDHVKREIEGLNTDEAKSGRCARFAVKGSNPFNYEERLYELGRGKAFFAGIRHLGCDPEKPFVLLTPNFKIGSNQEALDCYDIAKSDFEIFKPEKISFLASRGNLGDERGSITMAAKASAIAKLPALEQECRLVLFKPDSDAYLEFYQEGYRRLSKKRPDFKNKVTVNDPSLMRESDDENLLRLAYVEKELVGLIAAVKDSFCGRPGFYFNEIFIADKFRGRGYGRALQRAFIRHFSEPEEVVWGTIDEVNFPSLRTAQSNLRVPVQWECFLKV